jgi:hypothetical protein
MREFQVPVTGVSAVNARGELALFIEPVSSALRPTLVRRLGNRLAVLSGSTPVNVRGYTERTAEVARTRSEALVCEIDVDGGSVRRETMVPISDE